MSGPVFVLLLQNTSLFLNQKKRKNIPGLPITFERLPTLLSGGSLFNDSFSSYMKFIINMNDSFQIDEFHLKTKEFSGNSLVFLKVLINENIFQKVKNWKVSYILKLLFDFISF